MSFYHIENQADGDTTQALRASRGIDHSMPTRLHIPCSGNSHTTPKHLVQSTDESERAMYCTQYIARSLSARSAGPDSGAGGDGPTKGVAKW